MIAFGDAVVMSQRELLTECLHRIGFRTERVFRGHTTYFGGGITSNIVLARGVLLKLTSFNVQLEYLDLASLK